MLRSSDFSWDNTTKMIKCERQLYKDIYKKFKHAKGLWGVPFPYLDELDKAFDLGRAIGAVFENFEEAVNDLQNETIKLDKDEENDDDDEEGESVQLTRPTPKTSKKARKEPTPKGKGNKKASHCGLNFIF